MKITTRLLITSALLLLVSYSIYTTVRIKRLETHLYREQLGRPDIRFGLHPQLTHSGDTLHIAYAVDDSFRQYFGQKGVDEVERALEILRNPKIE
ncbi:MAG: hypothetical protein ABI651_18930 [Verrucomicrobiota bacterium]